MICHSSLFDKKEEKDVYIKINRKDISDTCMDHIGYSGNHCEADCTYGFHFKIICDSRVSCPGNRNDYLLSGLDTGCIFNMPDCIIEHALSRRASHLKSNLAKETLESGFGEILKRLKRRPC